MGNAEIYEYVSRIATGDKTCYRALCRLLAREILFVPVVNSTCNEEGLTKMKVFSLEDAGRIKVAIFTSADELEEWKQAQSVECEVLELLGGDLGTAVGEDAWFVVNPCRPYQIDISPSWVRFIAMCEMKQIPLVESEADQIDSPPEEETVIIESGEVFVSDQLMQELSVQKKHIQSHSPIKRKRLLLVQEHLEASDRNRDHGTGESLYDDSDEIPSQRREDSPPSSAMIYPQASMKYRRSRRRQFIEFLKSIW